MSAWGRCTFVADGKNPAAVSRYKLLLDVTDLFNIAVNDVGEKNLLVKAGCSL